MTQSGPEVSVVLPTYNESENLPLLIPRILETLQAACIPAEVIVVDDNSPDGTADVAEALAQRFPLRVVKRVNERGLATAVLAGFQISHAPVCVVMDADGSHPVDVLPQMAQLVLGNRADIVVGSRHLPGGGSRGWPVFSRLKSRLAAAAAIGLTRMTDPTTGMMAIRRELLNHLDLNPLGWKIVLEIVVKAGDAKVEEIPIVFDNRQLGRSKQSLHVLWLYLRHCYQLYRHRYF